MIRNEIVNMAMSSIGLEEIRGNLGFKDADFENRMKTMGWEKGQAWCAYFTELVWKYSYAKFDSTFVDKLDKLFSAGAVKTWTNFVSSSFETKSVVPEPGDVVIWQSYKKGEPHWTGHAGIVVEVNGNSFKAAEGNSNDTGGREGYKVALKTRPINFTPKMRGLVLKGFIKPTEI